MWFWPGIAQRKLQRLNTGAVEPTQERSIAHRSEHPRACLPFCLWFRNELPGLVVGRDCVFMKPAIRESIAIRAKTLYLLVEVSG
jgi:hypothetical protein